MSEPEDYIDRSTREAQELDALYIRWQHTAAMAVSCAQQAIHGTFGGYSGTEMSKVKIEAVSRIAVALIMSERHR
jgi:hypothetical protein